MEISIIEIERQDLSEWLGWPPLEVTAAILDACQRLMPEAVVVRTRSDVPRFTETVTGVIVSGANARFTFANGDGLLVGRCLLKESDEAAGLFLFLESPRVSRVPRIPPPTADIQTGPTSALHRWMAQFVR
jgi:hypothetical protein